MQRYLKTALGLSAQVLGFLATSAHAADIYYRSPNNTGILAVDEAGGPVRTVLTAAEYGTRPPLGITSMNHVLSNGQAFLRSTGYRGDIELLYRGPDGAVHTRLVTALAGNTHFPNGVADTNRDDSAFSFRTRDDAGNYRLYLLHVSVDQALAPDYVPPIDYTDPRLELLVEGYLDPATNVAKSYDHAWDGTGTRLVYHDNYQAANGEMRTATRVLDLATGTTTDLSDSKTGDINQRLDWNPTSGQILLGSSAIGQGGLLVMHAYAPGGITTILPGRSTTVKGKTTTNTSLQGIWSPDGSKVAFTHLRYSSTKSRDSAPAVTTDGWANATTLTPFVTHPTATVSLIGWSASP